jgi:hypothetical protein
VSATQLFGGCSGIKLMQDADNLLLGKALVM